MKTKIVYVIVCDYEDLYFEKAYISAWSAKYHNPSVFITVVIDEDSRKKISSDMYESFKAFINEEVIVPFDSAYSNIERSRWLKTKLRSLVDGDFLFLDVDTVICGDLSTIDKEQCSVGLALDFNCTLKANRSLMYYGKLLKKYYNQEIDSDGYYFNSGVIYAKDDSNAHTFLNTWHENWLHSQKQHYYRDQLALLKTSKDLSRLVSEISGIYNCQISANIQYFYDAKILHFYNMGEKYIFSPFLGNDIYIKVRNNKIITDDIKDKIINCKSFLKGPTLIMGGDDILIIESKVYKLLKRIFLFHKRTFLVLKAFAKIYFTLFK